MTAIAAVDVALWDIKGKALNTPVYNLLGGRSRDGVLVYCHANGGDIPQAIDSVQKHMVMGYLAVRAQAGVSGVASSYGVPKGGKPYEPAERGLPSESLWSTERYLNFAPKLFEQLRTAVGEDVHLLHDVHHRLTPIEAGRLVKRSNPTTSSGWRTRCPQSCRKGSGSFVNTPPLRLLPARSSTAYGDANDLIRNQWIDYLRMTIVHGGGITHLKRQPTLRACTMCVPGSMERPTFPP